MLFICYPKCSTCRKAQNWLDEHNIRYEYRHIKDENPGEAEIKEWYKKSGLPLKKFFNTSGMAYRNLNLKTKLPTMSEEEQIALLRTDGLLVKRPILLTDDGNVFVGFKQSEYETLLNDK
jgi:arsenate reductase